MSRQISSVGSMEDVSAKQGFLKNSLAYYYDEIQDLLRKGETDFCLRLESNDFNPGYELPVLDERMLNFLDCCDVTWAGLDAYNSVNITILNMTKNKSSQTTKIFSSLIMIARAIAHINKTGEAITIITPSSANKAMALREAVFRAIEFALVPEEKLNIISVIPESSFEKLRCSDLSNDTRNKNNPVLLYSGDITVKDLVGQFKEKYGKDLTTSGRKYWYTLSLENYLYADSVRAFIECDFIKYIPDRIEAHSVSSAYGLLGHNYGLKWRSIGRNYQYKSKYFLIQHLYNPDMVLDLYHDSFSRSNIPEYSQEMDCLFYQNENPHFPYITGDTDEILDPTFYSLKPPTSKEMKDIIRKNGGGGIVVSEYECQSRHDEIKNILKRNDVDISLPDSFYDVYERSFNMVFTGVLNAIDRGLITNNDNVMIHATGLYCKNDYKKMDKNTGLISIYSAEDINKVVCNFSY